MQHYLQSKFRWASALLDPCKLLAVHVYIFLHRKKINIKIHQSISIEIITLSFVVRSLSIPLLLVWDQVMVGGGTAIAKHVKVTLFPGEADVLVGTKEKLGEPVMNMYTLQMIWYNHIVYLEDYALSQIYWKKYTQNKYQAPWKYWWGTALLLSSRWLMMIQISWWYPCKNSQAA